MTALWEERRVIVTVGRGGVGKTSVAAALALAAAASGRRTLVMTIDPARRLANALGLADFGNLEHEVDPLAVAAAGAHLRAPLWAMMPDVKRTFDDVVKRTAVDAEQRRRILENRIYRQAASALAGSHEYAAVEKLYEVYRSRRYDLIVLDTPPSQNALDFLAAPNRVVAFLEQESVQLLLKPYLMASKASLRLFSVGTSLIYRSLGHLAGLDTMRAIAEFVLIFQGMYEGFRERAARVHELLHSNELAFVLVGTARGPGYESMLDFRESLLAAGVKPRALVLNRVHPLPYPPAAAADVKAALERLLPDAVARQTMLRLADEEELLAMRDQEVREQLERQVATVLALPELPIDVHDLASLVELHRYFLPSEERRGVLEQGAASPPRV
jgi:anion-transporting  ArsA/GET3 family ATPase